MAITARLIAEVSQEVEVAIESSVEENWNIGGAVTTSAGVEAGPEVCKVSAELSVEVSGGYGESKTKTKSRSVTYMVSAQLPPWSVANGSMIVEEGELEGDLIRKWRNLRTGTIIEEKGRIKIKNGARARGEIHGTQGEAPVTNFRTDEIEIEE